MTDFKNSMFCVFLMMFMNIVHASEAIKDEISGHISRLPTEILDFIFSFQGVGKKAAGICQDWEHMRRHHVVYKITSNRLSISSRPYNYLMIDNQVNNYSRHISSFSIVKFPHVEIRNADIDDKQVWILINICKLWRYFKSNIQNINLKTLILKNTSVTKQPISNTIDIIWTERSDQEKTAAHTRKMKKVGSYLEGTVNYLF